MVIPDLVAAAKITLSTCLGLKPGESLLIVEDDGSPASVVDALYDQAKIIGIEVSRIRIPSRQFHGQELPPVVAVALKSVDAFLGPTSKSFSHTDARREATKHGIRGATLPGVAEDMFVRVMQADYQQIKQHAIQLLAIINPATKIHITAANGTDVTLTKPHPFEPDYGIYDQAGEFGNLPAGEIMGAPANTSGILVFDRMGDVITEPTKIIVENNHIVDIQNNESGARLKTLLHQASLHDNNQNAYYIAELGIGLNSLAQITGNILEDEKVLGTCHIAVGDNTSYTGGVNNSSIHQDGIVINPTIFVDDQEIIQAGQHLYIS